MRKRGNRAREIDDVDSTGRRGGRERFPEDQTEAPVSLEGRAPPSIGGAVEGRGGKGKGRRKSHTSGLLESSIEASAGAKGKRRPLHILRWTLRR